MSSRQHVRVVRKSRGPESADSADVSAASLGRCVPPSSGCPLSLQPATNLALVCRFLPARDLLAAYKVCHALSSAAASPLTFQHEREWRIDPIDKGVETIGPAAVCTGAARLKAAMNSKLFRVFRILKLRADSEGELLRMLRMLQSPLQSARAPKLHVLQIECSDDLDVGRWPELLDFPFLRVLSLRSTELVDFTGSSFAGLPRLQVFELSHSVNTDDVFPSDDADDQYISADLMALLKAAPELRECIFRSAMPLSLTNEATETTTLFDVRRLERLEAEVPQLDTIYWMVAWSQERIMGEMEEALATPVEPPKSLPVLRKVRSALVNEVRLHFWPPQLDISEELAKCANVFRLVPQLTELGAFVRDEPRFQDDCARAFLMQLVAAALPLTSLTLLEQTAPRAWNQSLVRFDPKEFPALTSLSCNFPFTSLRDFAHMPHLHTFKELRYPSDEADRVTVEDPAVCFPSLTYLHVESGLGTRSLYTLIAQIPTLKHVASKLNAPQDPSSFIAAGLALIDQREAERVKLEKSAQLLGGWNLGDVPTVTHEFVRPPSPLVTFAPNSTGINSRTADPALTQPFEACFDVKQLGAKATSSPAKPATSTAAAVGTVAAAPPASSFAFAPVPAAAASPFSFVVPAAAFSAPSFGSSSFCSSSSAVSSGAFAFAPSAAASSFSFHAGTSSDVPFNPFAASSATNTPATAAAAPFSGPFAAFNFGSVAAALPTAQDNTQPPAPQ